MEEKPTTDFTYKLSKAISRVFHPIIMPMYGFIFLAYLSSATPIAYSMQFSFQLLLGLFLLICLIPSLAIYLLYLEKHISSLSLTERKERNKPYLILLIVSFSLLYFFGKALPMIFFYQLCMIHFLCVLQAFIINFFTKISAHAIGCGAMSGFLFAVNIYTDTSCFWLFVLSILISGLVCSARLKLNAHNNFQVTLGFILGICTTFAVFFTGLL